MTLKSIVVKDVKKVFERIISYNSMFKFFVKIIWFFEKSRDKVKYERFSEIVLC